MKNNRILRFRNTFSMFIALAILLTACGTADSDSSTATPEPGAAGQSAGTAIVIGNVESTNPADKIAEFQPLADYLAANLGNFGITEGKVVLARDTTEMANMLSDGEADIYFDAAFPALDTCAIAGCTFTLRQWKGGTPTQKGVFVTTKDSGITTLEDLRGKVIMLEQPHSTVGHILPRATLAEHGITSVSVSSPEAQVGPDEVGYYVSSGGETSMNLLLNGQIAALAIGDKAFKQFSPDVQNQVTLLAETVGAPSELVAFRPDVDPDLQAEVVRLMLALDQSDEGKAILQTMRQSEKFEELSQDVLDNLYELYDTVKQILRS